MDKYSATWVSHSSISDFLKCPRLYYLRNVYKDPKTKRKINIVSPALTLGLVVHSIIESQSTIAKDDRFGQDPQNLVDAIWTNSSGKRGGFTSVQQEEDYRQQALLMVSAVFADPGPLANMAIKIKQELPNYYLSEEDNIILCGKVDWLEYLPQTDSVHILDFKTGKNEEDEDSLQLPIYQLLVTNTQSKPVSKISYWYLKDNVLKPQKLANMEVSHDKVLEIARRIKLGRNINHLKCPKGGCFACLPFERLLKGEGEYVGESEYKQDLYVLS